jgi:protein-L-isoaspartate(D-aspartate) O-methyltransferase
MASLHGASLSSNVGGQGARDTFGHRLAEESMMKTVLVLALSASFIAQCTQERWEVARENMVQTQIVSRGIVDTSTLRAMRAVPRHEFVPSEMRDNAYLDSPLPIGYDQTISQPYIVALMTELINPNNQQRVLEIGTGSGYQAAVLAEIVDSVFSIELLPELASSASDRLHHLGYRNIVVRQGDGYLGWPGRSPFDAILVTAAAENIPEALVEQLRDGGVMVIPVGSVWSVQSLTLVRKQGKNIVTENVLPVRFVPLVHPR